MKEKGRLLGVDFGLKRVGFAVCDETRILATPLDAYKTSSMRDTIDRAAALAEEHSVVGIVVGLPLNMDGSESAQSGRVRAFCRNLERVSGLPVELVDERLTTVEADELLRDAGVKPKDRAALIDSMSAKVILQSFIENKKTETIMTENNENEDVELIDDEVITLTDDNGKPVDFYEVACIEYQGEFYALLQPVEHMEGVEEDEALIFKVREEDEENDVFEPVTDESVLDAVFNEYLKALEENADDCDCCCDHEHAHDGCCGHGGDSEGGCCDHEHGHSHDGCCGHGHDNDRDHDCGCEHRKKDKK